MIRLNGWPACTARPSRSSNVPWLSRPVRSSVCARISTARNTSAFWRAIDTCAANSWTSSNSSAVNVLPEPEPLDRQHADRALATAQRHDDEAAVLDVLLAEVVDPRVVRSSSM